AVRMKNRSCGTTDEAGESVERSRARRRPRPSPIVVSSGKLPSPTNGTLPSTRSPWPACALGAATGAARARPPATSHVAAEAAALRRKRRRVVVEPTELHASIAAVGPFALVAVLILAPIRFPNSGSPAAQPAFLRGVTALHNFQYEDAAEAF